MEEGRRWGAGGSGKDKAPASQVTEFFLAWEQGSLSEGRGFVSPMSLSLELSAAANLPSGFKLSKACPRRHGAKPRVQPSVKERLTAQRGVTL